MTERTYETAIGRAIKAAHAHGIAILDATFGKLKQREMLRERLAVAGMQHRFIILNTSDREIIERLRRRDQSKTEISDARLEDFEMLSTAYERPDIGEDDMQVIVESESSVEATVSNALSALVRLNL
jgi:predicted kinase